MLRTLATRIEQSQVMSLERLAGDDTWRGARPLLCVVTLGRNQHQLHRAADDLRVHAHRLVSEATELDHLARLPSGLVG